MIKYKTEFWFLENAKIEKVSYNRETESFIFIGDRRYRKETTTDKYFDSFDDAKNFLEDKISSKIAYLEKQTADLRKSLGRILGTKEEDI